MNLVYNAFMKVTIKELAEKAGVSKTAVSFAFNNPKRISADTYNRIMQIAREIGYSPDPVARILATHRTQTIGMLFPQPVTEIFKNPHIAELVRGVGALCDEKGYSLTLLSPLKGVIDHTVQNAAVDGMIILGVDKYSTVHDVFRQRSMPYVAIDADMNAEYSNVGIDDASLSEKLMDILLDNGHRRICFCSLQPVAEDLAESVHSITSDARTQGIRKSVEKHNLSEEDKNQFIYIDSETSFEPCFRMAKEVLSKNPRPTAVFCNADIQAFGFYSAAQELSLSIPEDLSVVSFDDLSISRILKPGLTAVHQNAYEKGLCAAKLLMEQLDGCAPRSTLVPASVEERGSVARI